MPVPPMGSQFYVCWHIWHCTQCQFLPWALNSMCVGTYGIVHNAYSSYGLSILCVSAHLALFTMPVLLWALNSMRVGIFGIVHNANFSYGLSILCVSAHLALYTMPVPPMDSQFYVCRHIWHCTQCQFFLWALNSMRVGTFGIVHNATSPMGSQFYACRHIWHCGQCQFFLWAFNSMRVGIFGIV